MNLYGMVGNDAVNAWDMVGLKSPGGGTSTLFNPGVSLVDKDGFNRDGATNDGVPPIAPWEFDDHLGQLHIRARVSCSDTGEVSGSWSVVKAWASEDLKGESFTKLKGAEGKITEKEPGFQYEISGTWNDRGEGAMQGAILGFGGGLITGNPVGGSIIGGVTGAFFSQDQDAYIRVKVTFDCVCDRDHWEYDFLWEPTMKEKVEKKIATGDLYWDF
jgi:hypothetical protein